MRPTIAPRRMLAIVSLALSLTACGGPTDTDARQAEAMAIADAWLTAVSRGGADDRGWSLLHPSSRGEWADEEMYTAAAEAADWSLFQFDVVGAHCDDLGMCFVDLDVPGGFESAPDFLRQPAKIAAVGLRFRDDLGSGNASLEVWLPDLLRIFDGSGVILPAG